MDILNKSCEPMEIDLSAHSYNEMDISYNISTNSSTVESPLKTPPSASTEDERESHTYQSPINDLRTEMGTDTIDFRSPELQCPMTKNIQPTNIKNIHIKMPKGSTHIVTKKKILSAAFILLLAIVTAHVCNMQCSGNLHPSTLKEILQSKLYGQDLALKTLIEALNVNEKSKILLFYGGTGVGKTFTASLIMEHLGHNANVYHYTMPSFMDSFTTDFMFWLTICKHSTFIIDDLSAKDIDVKIHINEVVTKSQKLDKSITVILIYNCDNAAKDFERQCDTSFPNKVIDDFKEIDAFKKLIRFEPLAVKHLKKCIETELGRNIGDFEFEKIVKNFNVSQDGCKGVYTKIKFMDI